MNNISCEGRVRVALPPDEAIDLFTPERSRRYARVTPGVQAGTVSVSCAPDGGGTVATVGYELTALGPDADLATFAAGYDDFLAGWERDLAASV